MKYCILRNGVNGMVLRTQVQKSEFERIRDEYIFAYNEAFVIMSNDRQTLTLLETANVRRCVSPYIAGAGILGPPLRYSIRRDVIIDGLYHVRDIAGRYVATVYSNYKGLYKITKRTPQLLR